MCIWRVFHAFCISLCFLLSPFSRRSPTRGICFLTLILLLRLSFQTSIEAGLFHPADWTWAFLILRFGSGVTFRCGHCDIMARWSSRVFSPGRWSLSICSHGYFFFFPLYDLLPSITRCQKYQTSQGASGTGHGSVFSKTSLVWSQPCPLISSGTVSLEDITAIFVFGLIFDFFSFSHDQCVPSGNDDPIFFERSALAWCL
jgi:hypothetical protein